jgi:hypothetical protein
MKSRKFNYDYKYLNMRQSIKKNKKHSKKHNKPEIDWKSIFAHLDNPEYIETINKMDKEIKSTDTNSYEVHIGYCIYIYQK